MASAALSTRGARALDRPPLLRCALFCDQFNPSNPNGLINLGVAENVSRCGCSSWAEQWLRGQAIDLHGLHVMQSLLSEYLIEYYESHFKLEYSDFTVSACSLASSFELCFVSPGCS